MPGHKFRMILPNGSPLSASERSAILLDTEHRRCSQPLRTRRGRTYFAAQRGDTPSGAYIGARFR